MLIKCRRKLSETTKQKIRRARLERKRKLGYINSPATRKKIGETQKRKGMNKGRNNPFYGRKHTIAFKKKMSNFQKSRIGEKSSNWKGENAKHAAIHMWVRKYKGKPEICEHCGITRKKRRMEWANKDHKYRRNLDDYFSLCISCHKKYDSKNKNK